MVSRFIMARTKERVRTFGKRWKMRRWTGISKLKWRRDGISLLKNICNCRTLHPLSIYKYPCLSAWLLLHQAPAEDNKHKEQLLMRYKYAQQRRLEEERWDCMT